MDQHIHQEKENDLSKYCKNGHFSIPFMRNILSTLNEEEQKVQLELYKEICTSWRALVDVRFKLLGLVPTVSIAIIIVLLTSDTNGLKLTPILIAWTQTGIALFGLVVTYGLYVYDQRNTQFHNYLKNQGSMIEKELGVDTGQFSGRLESDKSVLPSLRYLFNWNDLQENDKSKLIKFLKKKYDIDWATKAKIEKSDDGKTIRVSTETNYLTLGPNDKKNKVIITIDDGRTYEFIAKTKKGKLNIYIPISDIWIFHVKHSTGINLIYGAAIISWILAIVIIWVNWHFS